MCGEAAVTARVDEDGLERMYCAFHIVTLGDEKNDPLCDTIAERIAPECTAPRAD
jgi:hypothetical protein